MRELPFGMRISEEFVDLVRRETAKARAEWPDVLPCLSVEEMRRCERVAGGEPPQKAIDFEHDIEVAPINRLAPAPDVPLLYITDRLWTIFFDRRKHSEEETFDLDGLELYVSKEAQAELKGATLNVVNGKVVATYEPA